MSGQPPAQFVVFDVDGTLVDGQHAVIAAVAASWSAFNLDPPPDAAVRRVIGLPLELALERLLEQGGHTVALADVAEAFRQSFNRDRLATRHAEPLFPRARATIDALTRQAVLLGIATMKSRRGMMSIIERHALHGCFVTIQTADDGPGKPDPDMLHRAMREAGALPQNTVMVGDTSFDMHMARAAGVIGIGVRWGYHPPDELRAAGAQVVLDDFSGLQPALQELWSAAGESRT